MPPTENVRETGNRWLPPILIACLIFFSPSFASGQEDSSTTVEYRLDSPLMPASLSITTRNQHRPITPDSPTSQVTPASLTRSQTGPGSEITAVGTLTDDSQSLDAPVPIVPAPTGDTWILDSLTDETEICEPTCLLEDAFTYRWNESTLSWLPASDDNLGWITLESTPYLSQKNTSGITHAINIHWLNGPDNIHLPARVYDFVLGYQKRERLSDRFSYDVAASIGVYSDFEGSARDGVRLVSHAVGEWSVSPQFGLVFGVDYLDRDDIALLPVIGFQWQPWRLPELQIDAVFPRPEVSLAVNETDRLYVRGLLGGGTWDIEFPDEANDVMTYRDIQILFGLSRRDGKKDSRCELGYVFDRQLEFRNSPATQTFDDGFVIRFVTRQ